MVWEEHDAGSVDVAEAVAMHQLGQMLFEIEAGRTAGDSGGSGSDHERIRRELAAVTRDLLRWARSARRGTEREDGRAA